MKEKTALVLGGGGSRGAYEVGVWQALRELSIPIHIVTGTSVGALNGAMVVTDSFEEALSLWRTMDTEKLFDVQLEEAQTKKPQEPAPAVLQIPVSDRVPPQLTLPLRMAAGLTSLNRKTFSAYARAFFENGGADYTKLRDLLLTYLDEEAMRASPVDFGIVTVEKETLKPRFLYKEDIPQGRIVDYLLASSACFPAMKSYVIDDVEYIDGAYSDNIPVEMAVQKGATRIIAVDLEAPGVVRKLPRDPKIQFTLIQSPWDLGDFLLFEKENSRKLIRLGYLDTMKQFGAFDGHAYTYLKGSMDLRQLSSAELAGKIFGLDAGLIYSSETFQRSLAEHIRRSDWDAHLELLVALGDLATNPLRSITTLFKEASPQSVTLVIASILARGKENSVARPLIGPLRKLFRDQIQAAGYLVRSGVYKA